jgi:hypothetical protein
MITFLILEDKTRQVKTSLILQYQDTICQNIQLISITILHDQKFHVSCFRISMLLKSMIGSQKNFVYYFHLITTFIYLLKSSRHSMLKIEKRNNGSCYIRVQSL